MKKTLVMHARGEYVPQIIEAMRRSGYKLHDVADVPNGLIHLEFKPRKK